MTTPAFINTINATEPYASKSAEIKLGWLDDICEVHNYQETIDGEANPETKKQFADRMVEEQIRRWINGNRKRKAEIAISYEPFGEES